MHFTTPFCALLNLHIPSWFFNINILVGIVLFYNIGKHINKYITIFCRQNEKINSNILTTFFFLNIDIIYKTYLHTKYFFRFFY